MHMLAGAGRHTSNANKVSWGGWKGGRDWGWPGGGIKVFELGRAESPEVVGVDHLVGGGGGDDRGLKIVLSG